MTTRPSTPTPPSPRAAGETSGQRAEGRRTIETDVTVIGGGPAGSVVAGLLAQRGHRVTLLERETFPRYHIGESLITGMLGVLDELGALPRIAEGGFSRKNGLSVVWGLNRDLWSVNFAEIGGPYQFSYHVRRAEFDAILLDRARELGVDVVEQATVTAPLLDGDGRVVGVEATISGEPVTVRSRMVADASGQARVLTRRLTNVSWQEDLRNVAYWSYFDDTRPMPEGQEGNILVERVENGWFWAIPFDDRTNRLSVGFVTSTDHLAASTSSLRELFDSGIEESKQLKLLMEGSQRVEDFRTTRDWSYCSERFSGAGWLAVGDAAAFIDPLFSGGVCLAVLGADPAAKAIDVALRRPDLEEQASAAYSAGYEQMMASFLSYVRFFYDPTRDREDFFAQAQSMGDFHERYPEARQAFVAVISGVLALSVLFEIPVLDADDQVVEVPRTPEAAALGAS
jgi:halogenation protein CepH